MPVPWARPDEECSMEDAAASRPVNRGSRSSRHVAELGNAGIWIYREFKVGRLRQAALQRGRTARHRSSARPWGTMSRSALLARQLGMSRDLGAARRWLIAAVLSHLVISIVHGQAHAGAHVPLSRAANLFVFIVILAGPLVGLALTWPAERIGIWTIAITMAGSLVFGVVNHFVLPSPDHVAHVDRALATVVHDDRGAARPD